MPEPPKDPIKPPVEPEVPDDPTPPIQTPLQKKIEALDPEVKKILSNLTDQVSKLTGYQEKVEEEKAATKLQQYNTDRTEKYEELIKLRPDLKEEMKEAHLDRIKDILIGAKSTKIELTPFGTPPNKEPLKAPQRFTHERFKDLE